MLIILERGNQFDYVISVTKYIIEKAVRKRPAAPRRNWLSLRNRLYSYRPPLTVDLYAIFGRVVHVGLQEGGVNSIGRFHAIFPYTCCFT